MNYCRCRFHRILAKWKTAEYLIWVLNVCDDPALD